MIFSCFFSLLSEQNNDCGRIKFDMFLFGTYLSHTDVWIMVKMTLIMENTWFGRISYNIIVFQV